TLNSCNAAYLSVSLVIAFAMLDGSKNSIGCPTNSPTPNPSPISQTWLTTNSDARCESRTFEFSELLPPSNSKKRHGITTMSPTGYRVAAPKPEIRPTRRSSCQDWDFRSFRDSQMTSAHNRLLKM